MGSLDVAKGYVCLCHACSDNRSMAYVRGIRLVLVAMVCHSCHALCVPCVCTMCMCVCVWCVWCVCMCGVCVCVWCVCYVCMCVSMAIVHMCYIGMHYCLPIAICPYVPYGYVGYGYVGYVLDTRLCVGYGPDTRLYGRVSRYTGIHAPPLSTAVWGDGWPVYLYPGRRAWAC